MAETHRAAKRKRYTSNIITLEVGSTKEQLKAFEDTLTSKSPFFKAALEKQWLEGQSRVIKLPEDDFDVVAAYLDWITTGQLVLDETAYYDTKTGQSQDHTGPDYIFLARLYVYGEKIQDDTFCDVIITTMSTEFNTQAKGPRTCFPSRTAVHIIYEGTPEGSTARELMVAVYREGATAHLFNERGCKFPEQFLLDLLRSTFPKGRGDILPLDAQQFHKKTKD